MRRHLAPKAGFHRRAEIENDHAWAVLELEGEDNEIEKALAYVRGLGLLVNQMEGDVITG